MAHRPAGIPGGYALHGIALTVVTLYMVSLYLSSPLAVAWLSPCPTSSASPVGILGGTLHRHPTVPKYREVVGFPLQGHGTLHREVMDYATSVERYTEMLSVRM